jgi:hypothetical protein
MTSIADGSVHIQTSAESVPSTPCWFGEVALIVKHLRKNGVLAKISPRDAQREVSWQDRSRRAHVIVLCLPKAEVCPRSFWEKGRSSNEPPEPCESNPCLVAHSVGTWQGSKSLHVITHQTDVISLPSPVSRVTVDGQVCAKCVPDDGEMFFHPRPMGGNILAEKVFSIFL